MIKEIIKFILSLFGKKGEGTGLIESPKDYRDLPLSSLFGKKENETPKEYKIPYKLKVKNQGNTPYCVGYAGSSIKEYLEKKEGNDIEFDPVWLYNECKKIDGMPGFQGTYFRAVLKVLKNKGAKPLNGKESDADKYRIGAYAKVDTDFNSIRRAIYEFGAVLIGFQGSNQGWSGIVVRRPFSGESTWGHATIGIEFEELTITGQNSWGTKAHNEGLFKFLANYEPIEVWVVTNDLPNDWEELLKKGEKPQYEFTYNLSIGQTNQHIKMLQYCLKYDGCYPQEQDCTGHFGEVTKQAVILFQERHNIKPASGFVGPLTRTKLNELFNK